MERKLKFYGWGHEGEGLDEAERGARQPLRHRETGHGIAHRQPPPPQASDIALALPASRPPLRSPTCSREIRTNDCCTLTASPTLIPCAPSPAISPTHPISSRCRRPNPTSPLCSTGQAERKVAVVPFGAGSSVVGGVEPLVGDGYAGAVSLDMRRLNRVLEVDATSRAARIQAGILGPAIEAALKPHGFALRHYPQSFEFSTLGGWIATRSGGHFATLYTHIDDLVESLRTITPAGVMESRRLPGSGAGPSPDRMMIGSEGVARCHHRSVDAAARAAPLPRRRRVRLPRLLRCRSRCARRLPGGTLPIEPARHRQRRGGRLRRQRL